MTRPDYAKEIVKLSDQINKMPTSDLYWERANAYFDLGEQQKALIRPYELAVEDLNESLRLKPEQPDCHALKAVIFHQWDQIDLAHQEYTRALQLLEHVPARKAYFRKEHLQKLQQETAPPTSKYH